MIGVWENVVRTTFERVKNRLDAAWPVERDGSGPPERIAMKAAIQSFEPEISVISLRVDKTKHQHDEDGLRSILIYDFSWPGPTRVRFIGQMEMNDTSLLKQILTKQFGPRFAEDFLQDLEGKAQITGLIDTDGLKSLQSIMYDLTKRQADFEMDVYKHLAFWLERAVEIPEPLEKYVKRYGLTPTEIPAEEALKQPDFRTQCLVTLRDGEVYPLTLRDLAEEVSRVILIPPVPDEVRTTFQRAKDLYVYGYFKYDFFTITVLLAYMALEAAIRHRLRLELPESKRKKKGRMRELLDRLVEEGSMTLWERKECESAWYIRNSLAHPEHPSVYLPSHAIVALRNAANIINSLFDKR